MLIHGYGLLHAANLPDAGVPPMQVLGLTNLPLLYPPEANVVTTVLVQIHSLTECPIAMATAELSFRDS